MDTQSIEFWELDKIKPYEKNAKEHPKHQIEKIADSIKEFGFNQSIVIDKEGVIIVGHGRLEAAKLLGMDKVPVVIAELTEEQAKAYRLADNKLNESDWDMDLVIEELKGLELAGFDIELTGFDVDLLSMEDENAYTKKIDTPVYEPTGEKPALDDLLNDDKVRDFLKRIEKTNIPPAERDFLRKAAQRHCVFDYAKIAEYYAHSGKELQELMEALALVIIDFNMAVSEGYVRLSEKITEQYLDEYGDEE